MSPVFGYGMTIVRITRTSPVIVEACVPDSPADRAGIRPGTELLEHNGVQLDALDAKACLELLGQPVVKAGETERLRIRQNDEEHEVTLVSAEIVWPPERPAPAWTDPALEQRIHRGVDIVEYGDGSIGFEPTGSLSDDAVDSVLGRQ